MSRRVLPLILLCLITAVMAALLWPRPGPAGATGGVAAIEAGDHHTCAITTVQGLKCWGFNESGQLGNGTTANSSTPGDVSGLTSGVTAVTAGRDHTCALTTPGGVKCWGDNGYSQLGDGTTTDSSSPVDVFWALPQGLVAVSAGALHTCAVTTSGGLKCWGENGLGQLGNGTTVNSSTPVDVSGLTTGVAAVSAQGQDTCAITTAGGLKCWGANYYGQLGNGTDTGPQLCSGNACSTTPVDVYGLASGVAAVTGGEGHTCALTSAGGLKCWGYNGLGQLGNGTTTGTNTPGDVPSLTSGVAAVTASYTTCAVTTAGGLKCWGYNQEGELGNGTTTNSSTPGDVSGLTSGVAAVSAGALHTCALTTAGSLKCWGFNYYGKLGNGTTTGSMTPVDVAGLGPKPPSVGGVSLDAQLPRSSGGGAELLAGAVGALAAAAVALGGGAWYVRRRRSL